jgi:hypothetical protein
VDQNIARHKPLAKAAIAPNIAPHPADLATMLLMFRALHAIKAMVFSKNCHQSELINLGPFASIN